MPEKVQDAYLQEIVGTLLETENLTRKKAWKITKGVCKKYGLENMPTNIQILDACTDDEKLLLKHALLTKPTRTASGVATITVVPHPADCPGNCVYCPKGRNAPRSYTGTEPAIMRAQHNNYDPLLQVENRLDQYKLMGHPTDKVQMIIIGGTFLALDAQCKEEFIKRMFQALNDRPVENIEKAKHLNEEAYNRCIGLIIETRPDYCKKKHIDEMLRYGATMVEIGVQSIYPNILRKINRMHTIDDVKEATALAKDAGLKVNYHVMPGLPGADRKMDIEQFKQLFENPEFRPDALKIYPTLVVKDTELYEWWKEKKYEPMNTEVAVDVLAESMKYIPKYCRIVRIQRTMSANDIEAGVNKSNLRELVESKAEKKGIKIKEIRYREAGHADEVDYENAKLLRLDYNASGGKEIFLSYEDEKNDVLIGFLRMRIPEKTHKSEITDGTALVRELHVYGRAVPLSEVEEGAYQHRGVGKKLLAEAEHIAKNEFKKDKMVILSGVGVRKYYYKHGYRPDGPYVSKSLINEKTKF